MDDFISRKEAIEAIDKRVNEVYENIKMLATFPQRPWFDGMAHAQSILENLPSAQPEQAIKDCRNCKHGSYNDHWDTYFCYCPDDCNDWNKWEPSIQPFNKGLWVKQELAPQTLLFCSLCGCKKPQGVTGNFCPNCGADMR